MVYNKIIMKQAEAYQKFHTEQTAKAIPPLKRPCG